MKNRENWENCVRNCVLCQPHLSPSKVKRVIPAYIKDAKLWIQSGAPGKSEYDGMVDFQKDLLGKYLNKYLVHLGLSSQEVYLTYSSFCDLEYSNAPDVCKRWKYEEKQDLSSVKGYLYLGVDCFKQVMGVTGSVIDWWGYIFDKESKPYMFMPHPGYVQRRQYMLKDIYESLDTFGRLCGYK